MSCNCYKILVARTTKELQDLVHQEICKGLIPVGGVALVPVLDKDNKMKDASVAQAMASPSALINTSVLRAMESTLQSYLKPRAKRARA